LTFADKLRAAQAATHSRLCVGLDPDPERFPAHLSADRADAAVLAFNTAIIDATEDLACAYKLNLAFYEALGAEGWRALADTVRAIPDDRLVILDGKRGDIGNTARRYAEGAFDRLGADACTVAPYMGRDAIRPFLQHAGRCAFVLVATSNESGPDLQHAVVGGEPFYRLVARLAADEAARQPGEVGFVVGATRPELLAELRGAYPDVPFLVPGVGAQGGDPAAVVAASGAGPLLVNSSRGVLYASSGVDFARAARHAAGRLRETLGDPG
jgi:orotidine-5'-phosphate decarboxylase